jgi:hypothetical protein
VGEKGTVLAMRRCFVLLVSTMLVAAAAPTSQAGAKPKYKTAVGIGDQSALMFTNPSFKKLKIKKVRYFIPWNAARHKDQLAAADSYVFQARKAGVRVLMHISTHDLRNKKGKLPSQKAYKTYVGKLVKRYRARGVREWGVWNEANHKSQETWNHPAAAAKFFLTMRRLCRGCKIVSLDILDQPGATNYIKKWFTALGRKNRSKATIVGIHNYSDTNRSRSRGTRAILKRVKSYNRKADFWLTETGGLYGFLASKFSCSPTRQTRAIKYMFRLTKKYRHDITRLYSYNFFGTTLEQCRVGLFDAGIVDANGVERPAFSAFQSQARYFAR